MSEKEYMTKEIYFWMINFNKEFGKNRALKNKIKKAIDYINEHMGQDVLSDLTGANYLREYMYEPDGLLSILEDKEEE